MMRRAWFAVCWLAFLASPVLAEGDAEDDARFSLDATLERAARISNRALEYLAQQQSEDGSFAVEPGEDATRAPLAVTALVSLAFMAGGSTVGRGPYHETVRDSIEFLLAHQVDKPPPGVEPGGEPGFGYFTVDSDSTSKMHGHGFATLAVAQAYGTLNFDPTYGEAAASKAREDQRRMRRALVRAVRLIEESQSQAGGWNYEPYELDHEGSMTVLMIQALRAARNVGVDVDKGVIDRAIQYIHRTQDPNEGGFRYKLHSTKISYALTAAGVATLNATGTYDSDVIDLGIKYMRRRDPVLNADRDPYSEPFPFYGRLYAAQAYYVHRDPTLWRIWYPRMVVMLEGSQNDVTGHFSGSDYGRVYGTAMSCLVLQLPFQYLPIFQK
ncbi:MAG: hypothetical protein ACF8XB_15150 [Planctomycetota bacterium JB042]